MYIRIEPQYRAETELHVLYMCIHDIVVVMGITFKRWVSLIGETRNTNSLVKTSITVKLAQ